MHDKYGREIGYADVVKAPSGPGKSVIGRAFNLNPNAGTCNLNVASLEVGAPCNTYATASECELMLNADGTEPPAPDITEFEEQDGGTWQADDGTVFNPDEYTWLPE